MEKNFEKLDMDFLGGALEDGIIPVVESITNVGETTQTQQNDKDDDPIEPIDNPIMDVDSITDLEGDDDEPIADPVDPVAAPVGDVQSANDEVIGLAKFFSSKGYLEFDEEKDKDIDEEWIEANVEAVLTKRAEEALDPTIKYINDLYKKGVSLESLIVAQVTTDKLEGIDNEDLGKDEKLAESVVRQYYTEVMESEEEEVESVLEDLKDAGMLGKQAIKMKDKLIKFNQKAIENAAKEAEREEVLRRERESEKLTVLKKVVDSTSTFIEGIEMNATEKDKLYSGITKKDRSGLTEYQKKLMDPDMQLKVAQFILLYNGDLKPLEEKIKTNVVKNIKTKANTYTNKTPKDPKKIASEALKFIKTSLKS